MKRSKGIYLQGIIEAEGFYDYLHFYLDNEESIVYTKTKK